MGGFQRGGTSKLFENICLTDIYIFLFLKRLLISKKLVSYLEPFQTLSLEGVFGGVPWGGYPKLCQNICLLNIYGYQITLTPQVKPFKKVIFGGPFGESPGTSPSGTRRGGALKLCQNICLLNTY